MINLSLRACVFYLLSSPNLYLEEEEVQRSRCAKDVGWKTSEGVGGGGSKDPWDPLYFTSFPVTQNLVCKKMFSVVKLTWFMFLTARACSVARYRTARVSMSVARVNPQI